jgi:hypothetical protein
MEVSMMPYYQPTWNNPYQNLYGTQQLPTAVGAYQPPQPVGTQAQPAMPVKVDGPAEAMNRFLIQYPASQLVPGFVSDPLFDVNGRQFHTLSIEADGHRNLETFDFEKHIEIPISGTPDDYIQRAEFDELVSKVNSIMGGQNGVHGPVQAAAPAAAPAAAQQAGPAGPALRQGQA